MAHLHFGTRLISWHAMPRQDLSARFARNWFGRKEAQALQTSRWLKHLATVYQGITRVDFFDLHHMTTRTAAKASVSLDGRCCVQILGPGNC